MTKSSKVDLVGVGLNATDTVIPLSKYPVRGSKVEYPTATVLPGGQVASTVVACQQWGMRTRYVGKLGDDTAATLHREVFARAGVETQLITVSEAPARSHSYWLTPAASGRFFAGGMNGLFFSRAISIANGSSMRGPCMLMVTILPQPRSQPVGLVLPACL